MAWFIFILLAVLTIGGGLGVVVTRNVVHAALALLVSLIAVAGVYLILFAEFLALVQVLIYGGAIIIVLLFAIMLTRSADYPRITDNKQWPLAAVAALASSRMASEVRWAVIWASLTPSAAFQRPPSHASHPASAR